MPRWARICQLCWEVCNNDQYWPDEPRKGYEQGCDACGDEFAMSVNVHPDIVEETKATLEAEKQPNGYAAYRTWPDPVGRAQGD